MYRFKQFIEQVIVMKRFMFIVLLSTNVTADIILKDGICPSGYHQSGAYCIGENAPVITKTGICPSGYHQSGEYCLGNSVNSKIVVDKVGFCPTGFHQSGNYCIEN